MGPGDFNPFLDESRRGLRRLLGLLNRNGYSPTYGSFDRPFWHYRAVTGFESATMAQGVLPLALAWSDPIFGREYAGNPALLGLLEAGLEHWASLQHPDGSFDEWYPFERSHVATAFTAYAVSEAMLLAGARLGDGTRARILDALRRAASWLSVHLDDQVLNHTAGAVPALANILALTGDESLREGLDRNLALMAAKQSPEGWFLENGGFDAGYLSLSLDYLWHHHERTGDPRSRALCEKASIFLDDLVHPDGSSGGEYASRNTKYLMPRGLVAAAPSLPRVAAVLARYACALTEGRAVVPSTADDRYFVFFYLPNWMMAAQAVAQRGWPVPLPPSAPEGRPGTPGASHHPEAGLVVRRTGDAHLVLNYRKAGLYKLFRRGAEGWAVDAADDGMFLRDHEGGVYSTQFLSDGEAEAAIDGQGMGTIRIRAPFKKVNYNLPLTNLQIPFLAYAHTLGRFSGVNALFERTVKNLFIRKPSGSPYLLERTIRLEGDRIVISDRIEGPRGMTVELLSGPGSTAPHVPSSRYFVPQDLALPARRRGIVLPSERTKTLTL